MSDRYYAGIGSRKTPPEILAQMREAATILGGMKLILRSGAAEGADTAFEEGLGKFHRKQIFLPWKRFNSRGTNEKGLYLPEDGDWELALGYAQKYHPAWSALTDASKKLMGRNTYQVLGLDCDTPSLFVLCWTPNGSGSGGTGQAIRLAKACSIPVFDLGSMTLDQAGQAIEKLL